MMESQWSGFLCFGPLSYVNGGALDESKSCRESNE